MRTVGLFVVISIVIGCSGGDATDQASSTGAGGIGGDCAPGKSQVCPCGGIRFCSDDGMWSDCYGCTDGAGAGGSSATSSGSSSSSSDASASSGGQGGGPCI